MYKLGRIPPRREEFVLMVNREGQSTERIRRAISETALALLGKVYRNCGPGLNHHRADPRGKNSLVLARR